MAAGGDQLTKSKDEAGTSFFCQGQPTQPQPQTTNHKPQITNHKPQTTTTTTTTTVFKQACVAFGCPGCLTWWLTRSPLSESTWTREDSKAAGGTLPLVSATRADGHGPLRTPAPKRTTPEDGEGGGQHGVVRDVGEHSATNEFKEAHFFPSFFAGGSQTLVVTRVGVWKASTSLTENRGLNSSRWNLLPKTWRRSSGMRLKWRRCRRKLDTKLFREWSETGELQHYRFLALQNWRVARHGSLQLNKDCEMHAAERSARSEAAKPYRKKRGEERRREKKRRRDTHARREIQECDGCRDAGRTWAMAEALRTFDGLLHFQPRFSALCLPHNFC